MNELNYNEASANEIKEIKVTGFHFSIVRLLLKLPSLTYSYFDLRFPTINSPSILDNLDSLYGM
jgi:hypothetical protein